MLEKPLRLPLSRLVLRSIPDMSDQQDADDHSLGGQRSKTSQANQIYQIELNNNLPGPESWFYFLYSNETCTEFKCVSYYIKIILMNMIDV